MRTKHTYICELCGKEQPKDWLFKGKNDDHAAICKPCFDARMEILPVPGGGDGEIRIVEFHDKLTGERRRGFTRGTEMKTMANPKLYCGVFRFHELQSDGSAAVAIFNRSNKRAPTQQEIDDVCEYACDQIDAGELIPGEVGFSYTAEPTPELMESTRMKFASSPEKLHAWAQDKFQVGIWLSNSPHKPHTMVQ
jgi:hypothetical protein